MDGCAIFILEFFFCDWDYQTKGLTLFLIRESQLFLGEGDPGSTERRAKAAEENPSLGSHDAPVILTHYWHAGIRNDLCWKREAEAGGLLCV